MCMYYRRFLEHTEYRTWNFRVQVYQRAEIVKCIVRGAVTETEEMAARKKASFFPDDGKLLPAEEVDFVLIGAGAVTIQETNVFI